MTLFEIHRVITKSELDSLTDVIWECFYDPYLPEFNIFHPLLGQSASEHDMSIRADKDRKWRKHSSDPASNWFYVLEPKTNKVVGGAQWLVHDENPFLGEGGQRERQDDQAIVESVEGETNGSDTQAVVKADMWPPGPYRDFADEFMRQYFVPKRNWMQRGHIALNSMVVLPSYRRQGIGGLLMDWGIQQAEQRNLECWCESTKLGIPLYEKYGFRVVTNWAFDAPLQSRIGVGREDAGEDEQGMVRLDVWSKLRHEYNPGSIVFMMWRPKGGKVRDGEPHWPWEVANESPTTNDQ